MEENQDSEIFSNLLKVQAGSVLAKMVKRDLTGQLPVL